MPSCRQRYRRMRRTLIKFRSLVHIYVNRRRYLKVSWGLAHPGGPGDLLPPCCMFSGGSGEGTVASPDREPPYMPPYDLLRIPLGMGSAS